MTSEDFKANMRGLMFVTAAIVVAIPTIWALFAVLNATLGPPVQRIDPIYEACSGKDYAQANQAICLEAAKHPTTTPTTVTRQ